MEKLQHVEKYLSNKFTYLRFNFTTGDAAGQNMVGRATFAAQRECLEIMGCFGKGKVNKLAEIVAGTVLAGEISLAGAISSLEWVSAHEEYGRNR